MGDDIMDRMRARADSIVDLLATALFREGADEIERLRAENQRFQTENGILRAIVGAYADQYGQGILKASVATLLAAATKDDDRG